MPQQLMRAPVAGHEIILEKGQGGPHCSGCIFDLVCIPTYPQLEVESVRVMPMVGRLSKGHGRGTNERCGAALGDRPGGLAQHPTNRCSLRHSSRSRLLKDSMKRLRYNHRCSRSQRSLAPATPAHHQLLFTVQPIELLAVHRMSFTSQQPAQTSIAEATTLLCQIAQLLTQRCIFCAPVLIAQY
jgi:hypothetical protein